MTKTNIYFFKIYFMLYLIFYTIIIILGYLLSKESVKRFVEKALPHEQCRQDHGGAEDVEIG